MPAKSSAKTKKSAKPVSGSSGRKLKPPKYNAFRLSKRIKHPGPQLPSAFRIFITSLSVLKKYWRRFAVLAGIYLVLSVLLVRGLGGTDLPALKQLVSETLQGQGGQLTVGFTVFGLLLGTTNETASQEGAIYQTMLLIGATLVFIWALRQANAGAQFSVKEAIYKAFYPLIPFLFVLLFIGLQLLPFVVANVLYSVVLTNGAAITAPEQFAWVVLIGLLIVWSLYMISSSILALYIVTLPDMLPVQALRSARKLVRYRRWAVMRKVIFLPFALLLIGVLIMLPVILFLTPVAEWVFLALTTASLVVVNSYLYSLYRELLA